MGRHVLEIAVALVAFSVGFLTAGEFAGFTLALPLALCVFVFSKTISELRLTLPSELDSHKFKVAVITVLLWIPVLVVFLPLLIPQSSFGNCTPDLP